MYRILILLTLFSLGCKTDPAPVPVDIAVNNTAQPQVPAESAVTDLATNNKIVVPNATTLIPEAVIGKIINQDPAMIETIQGNPLSEKNYQSAFIKWPADFVNAGILLQVSRNPVYDEYRDWAISYIDTR